MPLPVTIHQARRFQLEALGLARPFPDIPAAIDHLGYIQMDPINVCGRMHDLILRNRVQDYREGDLLRHLYSTDTRKSVFEHYLPSQGILVTFPADAWPYLVPHMQLRRTNKRGYAGKLSAAEERVAGHILRELTARGPLTSDEIEHEGRAVTGWGTQSRLVKTVLDKLFVHGRVLIANRQNFRRVYDLPERVLPSESLAQKPRSEPETHRWLILQRLKQRRLATLRRNEHSLVGELVEQVQVESLPPLFCLRSDRALLESIAHKPSVTSNPRLLAPLDPLIYDRRLTERLWSFDYTWEVYTPPAKRVRGYYALPLLSGVELVGHVDPKADRKSNRLQVVNRSARRGHRTNSAVKELASFLGLRH